MNDNFLKKEYTFEQRFNLGFALEHLAKAMRSRLAYDVDNEVDVGMRYLLKFINDVKPCAKMSKEAICISRSVHNYLRKYCDSPNTTLLYNLVSNGTGYPIWTAFCESLVSQLKEKTFNWRDIDNSIALRHDENRENPDNLIMLCALKTWGESKEVDSMVKFFKENTWG